MTERTVRFPLVDALRAIAALSIVMVHGLGGSEVLREEGGETAHLLAANLYIGVPIFFLISGFLLYRPFALANIDTQKPPWVVPGESPCAIRRSARAVSVPPRPPGKMECVDDASG